MNFRISLKAARVNAKMEPEQVVKLMGFSAERLADLEEERAIPTDEEIELLAVLYGVPLRLMKEDVPEVGEHVTVEDAARIFGIGSLEIREMMKHGELKIGMAIQKGTSTRYTFYIFPQLLTAELRRIGRYR